MRIHIGIKLLLHNKIRLLLSILGIAFSVVIMFMQLGFFNGVNDSQARIAGLLNADLVVLSKKRKTLNKVSAMPRTAVNHLGSLDGVEKATPIYRRSMNIKNNITKSQKRIIVRAFPVNEEVFTIDGFDKNIPLLKTPGTVLYDIGSRDIFGSMAIGETIELDAQPYTIVGHVKMGPNLVNDGMLFMSEGSMFKHKNNYENPRIILLHLDNGVSIDNIKDKINKDINYDLSVYTPKELHQREIMHTIKSAPVGIIFGIGLIVGMFIGTIICYQILYNEITDHISQYATLKAMGYPDKFLKGIIMEEAMFLAVIGFIPGLLASFWMYRSLEDSTALLMNLTPERISIIFAVTVLMCIGSGQLALKQVLKADPADLY
jgi:putative ABC transport system permease protein